MKKKNAGICPLLFMLALSAAGCAPGGQATEPPEVVLVDIVPQRLTLFEQQLRVDVRIRNPTNAPLAVTGLKFNLDLNGIRLLQGLSNQSIEVPRLGEAVVSSRASTTTLSLIRQAVSLNPDKPFEYKMEGTVFLEGIFQPRVTFKSEGKIDLPKFMDAIRKNVSPNQR